MKYSSSIIVAISALTHQSLAVDLLVPTSYSTIQSAIDASVDGDTILVEAGTYAGPFTINGKGITLRSVAGPLETILTGEDSHRVLTLLSVPNTCLVEGFTIAQGAHSEWTGAGGITSVNSSATVRACRFYRNRSLGCYPQSAWGAAAFYGEGGSPVIEGCSFVENSAAYSGSGVYQYRSGTITIRSCDFARNGTGGQGTGGSPCNFTDNGTIHLQNEGGSVVGVIEQCRFSGTIGYGAQVINCWSPGGVIDLTVQSCSFTSPVFTDYSGSPPYDYPYAISAYTFAGSAGNVATLVGNAICGYPTPIYLQAEYVANITDQTETMACTSPDVDGDGLATGKELAAVLSNWGNWGTGQLADFNTDGIIDGDDLAAVLGAW
jgi:hypothetical protein